MNNPLYLLGIDTEDATDLMNLLLNKKVPFDIGIWDKGRRYDFQIDTLGLEESIRDEVEKYVSALKRWSELA